MTEPTEPPVLTLGPATQQATQVILTWTHVLAARRAALGRLAWSDAEDAARAHDLRRRGAAPPIRAMDSEEAQHWERAADVQKHTAANDTDELSVSVGALHNDRWGVAAHLHPRPGQERHLTTPDGRPIDHLSAYVSCEDQETADRLVNQLLTAGPDRARLQRLQDFAATASRRALDALAGHGETWEQRKARTADTVRHVWPAQLAHTVTHNEAFGALAWRLFELEQRGYDPADVLRSLNVDEISGDHIRNRAAFAEWCVEHLAEDIPLVNLAEASANVGSQRRAGASPDRRADRTVQPSTQPSTRPSADHPIPKRVAMERLLEQSDLPADLVTKLTSCDAWPTLAKKLTTYQQQGFPVLDILADMPHDRLLGARTPAAYASTLLDNKTSAIAAARDQSSPHTRARHQPPIPTATATSKPSHPVPSPTSTRGRGEHQRAEHTTEAPAAETPAGAPVEQHRTTHDRPTPDQATAEGGPEEPAQHEGIDAHQTAAKTEVSQRHGDPAGALRAQASFTPPNRGTDKPATTTQPVVNAQPPPRRPLTPTPTKLSRHR